MLENPENLEMKETKIERLEIVLEDLMKQLPTGIKLLAQNFIDQSPLFKGEEHEDKINLFIEKTRGDFKLCRIWNHTNEPEPQRTLPELHRDQT